jgi:hypothetical protein
MDSSRWIGALLMVILICALLTSGLIWSTVIGSLISAVVFGWLTAPLYMKIAQPAQRWISRRSA